MRSWVNTVTYKMKHIKRINEWIQLNESYFGTGAAFAKIAATGLSIIDKLVTTHGFSPMLASAFAGNMFHESKFIPTRKSDNGLYYGLVQWGGNRWKRLLGKPDHNTIDGQLAFVKEEWPKYVQAAENKSKEKYKKPMSELTIEELAWVVAKVYEGCANPDHPERINGAAELYALYSASHQSKPEPTFAPPVVDLDTEDFPQPVSEPSAQSSM